MNDRTKASEESEVSLIGAMLFDPACIGPVSDIVVGEDYTDKGLGQIHTSIIELWSDGTAVEPSIVAATVSPHLSETVWACFNATGTAVSAPHHARLVKDASIRREGVSVCVSNIRMLKEDDRDTADVLGDAQTGMLQVAGVEDEQTLDDALAEVEKDSEEASANQSHVVGVPYGFRRLDLETGGMGNGDMIVIASRPNMGKTALVINIIWSILRDTEYGGAFFSAEMRKKAIALRMVSQVAKVDSLQIRTGRLSAEEKDRCRMATENISERARGRLLLDDTPSPTLGYMQSRIMQARSSQRIDFVVMDHFHKMGSPYRMESVLAGLDYNARGWKNLAAKLEIPALLLVQLNRGAEKSSEMPAPMLSEIKGCGAVEEEADVVIFPHRRTREDQYGELILAKQRDGQVGRVGNYAFDGPTTTWREM